LNLLRLSSYGSRWLFVVVIRLIEEVQMKTFNTLSLALLLAIGSVAPLSWAGEPNPDALGSGQPKTHAPSDDASKGAAGREC
jgi:hypothetical protein